LPCGYLSATHRPGDWRDFGEMFDRMERAGGPDWLDDAIVAAKAAFNLYFQAAVMT
jgi:hypothetical protein